NDFMDFDRLMLIALLAVPATAALVVAVLGARRRELIRRLALAVTVLNLLLTCALVRDYVVDVDTRAQAQGKPMTFEPKMVPGAEPGGHKTTWNLLDFGTLGAVQFYIGLDGINLWLVVLTAVLMVPSVLISWNSIDERANEYYAWLLLLGTGLL